MMNVRAGLAALVMSAAALAAAPAVLDDSYSWVEHTTSESGAQGASGAWLARTGFVLFGLAVIWISSRRAGLWPPVATALHLVFAVCMVSVAAYSTEPWIEGLEFDATEDTLHSVAATVMGFAFAFGVLAVAAAPRRGRRRWFDGVAMVASVVLPLGMTQFASVAGVLQRLMFGVAYCWYAAEGSKGSRPWPMTVRNSPSRCPTSWPVSSRAGCSVPGWWCCPVRATRSRSRPTSASWCSTRAAPAMPTG